MPFSSIQRFSDSIPASRESSDPPPHPPRLHAFDALRAMAMLLGVVIHAGMVYVQVPELAGVELDRKRSTLLLCDLGWIHSFRMQLFFVVGGFFAAMICQRLGPGGFLAHRARRLLLPLIASMVLLMPITASLMRRRITNPELLQHLSVASPGPYWFLEYLFLLCLIAFLLVKLVPASWRENKSGLLDCVFLAVVRSRWKPALLAVPVAAVLSFSPLWIDIEGMLPGLSPIPSARVTAYYGLFFLFGWLLHRHPESIGLLDRREWGYALLALPAFVLMLTLFLIWFQESNLWLVKAAGVWLHALTSWLWIFVFTGFFLRYFARPRPWVRYLADSSYWVYLMHVPLVLWLQLQISAWDTNVWVKFFFVYGTTMALLLVAYQLLVRQTFVGVFLNGRRAGRERAVG